MSSPLRPVRVAVKIQCVHSKDGHKTFRASLPMGVLFEKTLDSAQVESERLALEQKYAALVATLRAKRAEMKSGGVLRYWEFGDTIKEFENAEKNNLLFVDKLNEQLEREVNFSKTMIDLCRRFREHLPDASQIDARHSFNDYHRNGFDPARITVRPKRQPGRPRKTE